MLEHLLVKDLFVPMSAYLHVQSSETVLDAIKLMFSNLSDGEEYRSILVHDRHDHLLGYLSVRDLIRAVGPSLLRKSKQEMRKGLPFQELGDDYEELSIIWQVAMAEKVHEGAKVPVLEAMTPLDVTVMLDDQIAKCITILLKHHIYIIPVIDEQDCIIGVVRLVDIFQRLASKMLTTDAENPENPAHTD